MKFINLCRSFFDPNELNTTFKLKMATTNTKEYKFFVHVNYDNIYKQQLFHENLKNRLRNTQIMSDFATTSLHLCQMTCKVLGILSTVSSTLCYQGNLHLLGEALISQHIHSARRMLSTGPPSPTTQECFFCEKLEIKDAHRKTERPELLLSRKNKVNT